VRPIDNLEHVSGRNGTNPPADNPELALANRLRQPIPETPMIALEHSRKRKKVKPRHRDIYIPELIAWLRRIEQAKCGMPRRAAIAASQAAASVRLDWSLVFRL
jgi:hypothetical protein